MQRIPSFVSEKLNEGARNGSCRFTTGVEIRFRMQSDTVKIMLSAEKDIEAVSYTHLFVKETAGHLGIRLQVYSRPGEGTRFTLRFSNNTAFFNLNIDAEREAEE